MRYVGVLGLFTLYFNIYQTLDKRFFKQLWDVYKKVSIFTKYLPYQTKQCRTKVTNFCLMMSDEIFRLQVYRTKLPKFVNITKILSDKL